MNHPNDIPICESLDEFAWNPDEVRDLIQTTPLRFDEDGLPAAYDAEQLFGMSHLTVRETCDMSHTSMTDGEPI
jgi:hypothetical protein